MAISPRSAAWHGKAAPRQVRSRGSLALPAPRNPAAPGEGGGRSTKTLSSLLPSGSGLSPRAGHSPFGTPFLGVRMWPGLVRSKKKLKKKNGRAPNWLLARCREHGLRVALDQAQRLKRGIDFSEVNSCALLDNLFHFTVPAVLEGNYPEGPSTFS